MQRRTLLILWDKSSVETLVARLQVLNSLWGTVSKSDATAAKPEASDQDQDKENANKGVDAGAVAMLPAVQS